MEICQEDAARLNIRGEVPRLHDYDVSPSLGFMCENLNKLPEYFDPWWEIASRLEEFVEDGTLRDRVLGMPFLDYRRLDGEPEWHLAHVVLAYITSCYVWAKGENHIPQCLPKNVAVPYWAVSEHLGIIPTLCQASSVLYNWELIDPSGPLILENMKVIIPFIGGQDAAWFFLVSGQVEIDFASALRGIICAQQAVKELDTDGYTAALGEVQLAVRKMRRSLLRMRERCRPWVFYNVMRPFLAGWNCQAYKDKGWEGLIYEGVSSEPFCTGGGSAAQSSTLPCLDAALSLKHRPQDENLCADFRKNMRPLHRKLIKALAKGPSIRQFATFCQDSRALKAYNDCLTAITEFRSCHIQIVTEYIIIMSHRQDANANHSKQATLGTGGTGFMHFLKGLRSTVKKAFYVDDEGTEIN